MRPQSEKVADYLFSELDCAEIDALDRMLEQLIAALEAKDAKAIRASSTKRGRTDGR